MKSLLPRLLAFSEIYQVRKLKLLILILTIAIITMITRIAIAGANTTTQEGSQNIQGMAQEYDGINWIDYNGSESGGYLPDISQWQDFNNDSYIELIYCVECSEANIFCLLDKLYALGIFNNSLDGEGYIGGDINGDGSSNVVDLCEDLYVLRGSPFNIDAVDNFLTKYNLSDKFSQRVEDNPSFALITDEVCNGNYVRLSIHNWMLKQVLHPLVDDDGDGSVDEDPIDNADNDGDGKIDEDPGSYGAIWEQYYPHFVSIAGTDATHNLVVVSDSAKDAAENGGTGIVRPEPAGHVSHTSDYSVHNNEVNASHDIYSVISSPSPDTSNCALQNYRITPDDFPPDLDPGNLPPGYPSLEGPLSVVVEDWGTILPPFSDGDTFGDIIAAYIIEPHTIPPACNTKLGYSRMVDLGSGVKVEFSKVTMSGDTSFTITGSPPQEPPIGIRFIGSCYDITTNARYPEGTSIDVTITYDPGEVQGDESGLRLYHWKNNNWETIAVTVDRIKHTVTGRVTSLSPFIVGMSSVSGVSGGGVAFGINTNLLLGLSLILVAGGCIILYKSRRI